MSLDLVSPKPVSAKVLRAAAITLAAAGLAFVEVIPHWLCLSLCALLSFLGTVRLHAIPEIISWIKGWDGTVDYGYARVVHEGAGASPGDTDKFVGMVLRRIEK